MREKEVLKLKLKLGFENSVAVDCRRRSGGLALFWKKEVSVKINSYSMGHIDAVVGGGK